MRLDNQHRVTMLEQELIFVIQAIATQESSLG